MKTFSANIFFWSSGTRTRREFWQDAGVDLVIDRREGYFFWDMAGRRLIDLHLNGGTYNLGHRNPELIATLEQAMGRFDIGNHHFPALARTALAEALVETCPPNMQRVIYGSGGGEATDIAIKTARHTRQKRKIVSIRQGLPRPHRPGGGDRRRPLLASSSCPTARRSSSRSPFNDLDAMEEALKGGDVAGVVIETIPATYGFPLPEPGYLQAVKALCERHGALYIADEVQTGLMRTGEMWGVTKAGIEPDIMVVGKGITGGMYPIACAVVSEECSGLAEGGRLRPHLDRRRRRARLHRRAEGARDLRPARGALDGPLHRRPLPPGLRAIQELYPDWFVGIRQDGVVMGLEFDHPQGAKLVMRHLYENGVWAIFSTLDPRVLQFKPGILLGPDSSTRCSTAPGWRSGRRRAATKRACDEERRPEAAESARARMMLERARWAATAFAEYDRERTRRVVEAVAEAAYQNAERFAVGGRGDRHGRGRAQAAQERGLLARHRRALRGRGLRRGPGRRRGQDRRVPRPAGVVLALTPSTNPIATVYFKVLLALMTRNAVVVVAAPARAEVLGRRGPPAREAAVEGRRAGRLPAGRGGADDPADRGADGRPGVDVIVATGGPAVVRAAYRSGNPARRRPRQRAGAGRRHRRRRPRPRRRLIDSKAFDNSILCTNESVRDRRGARRGRLRARARAPRRARARPEARSAPARRSTPRAGSTPRWSARTRRRSRRPPGSGRRGHARARGAVPAVVPEEPLAHEKLFPLLGLVRVPDAARGDRRRPRAAADRRRRPLGGDPLARPADDPGLRRRGAACCGWRSTRRAAPARPGSTPTSRRR